MQVSNKLMMLAVAVIDMPKAREAKSAKSEMICTARVQA
jgi:hypothetical protein